MKKLLPIADQHAKSQSATHSATPNKGLSLTAGCLLTALAPMAGAQAYESGDMMLRFGAAVVAPDTKTGSIYFDGEKQGGSDWVDVDSGAALGISFTYMFMPILGIEILAATPFEHDIEFVTGEDLGSTKQLPPTLSLQYYPIGNRDYRWQPYLGLGLNYTTFFDEDLKSGFGDSLDLDDSFGIAASLGLDWLIGDHWFANASIMWVDLNTEATLKTGSNDPDVPAEIVVKDIELDPWVYRLNAGYRF